MPADNNGYLLSGETVKKIATMWKWFERQTRNPHQQHQQAQHTSQIFETWIGVLQGSLAYGSSASVTLYKWDGSSGFTATSTTVTCYPWMMNTGDSIAANVEVVGGIVNGKRVVFNAACKNIYGS